MLDSDSFRLNTVESLPKLKEKTLFTSKDHAILRQALKSSKECPTGNKLYIDLAKCFPHHTWQSWRDYAIKKYLPNVEKEAIAVDQENVDNQNDNNANYDQNTLATDEYNAQTSLVSKGSDITGEILISNIAKKDLDQSMISEVDKNHINQFLKSYNDLAKEFDLWDHDDIMKALFMASGSFKLGKKILLAGFNINELDLDSQALVFTHDHDNIVRNPSSQMFSDLLISKGQNAVYERSKFLRA